MRKYLIILLAALAAVACGGPSHNTTSTSNTTTKQATHPPKLYKHTLTLKNGQAHTCTPGNAVMQCFLTPPPPKLSPAASSPTAYGVDFAWSCALSQARNFGASYFSNSSKDWTSSCIHSFLSSGKKIVVVWETSAARTLGGYQAGVDDAKAADGEAHRLGLSSNIHIDYAVDFDETPGEAPTVASYFKGADSVNGVSRTGAYGSYYVVTRLCSAGLTSQSWQTYAWSGGQWAPASCAPLEQYLNDTSVDYDRAISSTYGQYPNSSPTPQPKPVVQTICWGKGATPKKSGCPKIISMTKHDWTRYLAFKNGLKKTEPQLKKVKGVIFSLEKDKIKVSQNYTGPGRKYLAKKVAGQVKGRNAAYGKHHVLTTKYSKH